MSAALDAALRDAHARGDRAALVTLYAEAAGQAATEEAAAFYLTQAYVFALETGDGRAAGLRARLVAMGREAAGHATGGVPAGVSSAPPPRPLPEGRGESGAPAPRA